MRATIGGADEGAIRVEAGVEPQPTRRDVKTTLLSPLNLMTGEFLGPLRKTIRRQCRQASCVVNRTLRDEKAQTLEDTALNHAGRPGGPGTARLTQSSIRLNLTK